MSEGGNIRVFARVRPLNAKQLSEQGKLLCVDELTDKTISLKVKQSSAINQSAQTRFSFDRVFGYDSTQQEVFETIGKDLVDTVFEGINGTVFAYGQTSSGKTFTCMGPDISDQTKKGLLPRIVQETFRKIQESPDCIEFRIKVSMVEIYNEKIKDLLDLSKSDLKIRESKTRGIYIQDITQVYVSSPEQVASYISTGSTNRAIAQTQMSAASSRSHMLFFMTVSQNNLKELSAKSGRFTLIDLAGSEKLSKTGAEGKQLEEAKNINKSLSSLGNVINALTESKVSHIPYRDSKLTRILQESLGGNAKTNIIINISPSIYNDTESLNTLRFGNRAKSIKNKPKVNKEFTVPELLLLLEKAQEKIKQQDRLIKELNRQNGLAEGTAPKLSLTKSKKNVQSDDQEPEQPQKPKISTNAMVQTAVSHNLTELVPAALEGINLQEKIRQLESQHDQKIQVLLQNIQELNDQKTELSRNYELVSEKYETIRRDAYHLQAKLATLEKQNQVFLEKQVSFELANQELKETLDQLNDKLEVFQEKERVMQMEAEKLRQQEDKLQIGVGTNNNIHGSMLRSRIFEPVVPLATTRSAIRKQQGASDLLKQIEELRAKVNKLEEENHMYSHLEEQKERLIAQKLEFDNQRMRMMHDLENRCQKVVELEEEIDNEKQRREHLLKIIEMDDKGKSKRILSLENYVSEISTSYYVLKNQQASWKSENKVFESKLKRRNDRVADLQRELSVLKEELYIQKLKHQQLMEKHEEISRRNFLDINIEEQPPLLPLSSNQDSSSSSIQNKKIVKVLRGSMIKGSSQDNPHPPPQMKKVQSSKIQQQPELNLI